MNKVITGILISILSVSVYLNAKQRSTIAEYKSRYDRFEIYDTELVSIMFQGSPDALRAKSGYEGKFEVLNLTYTDKRIICINYTKDNQDCFFQTDITDRGEQDLIK
jgi:hypothetical protein